MKCYISGKISGLLSEQVTAKFRQAEQQIRAFGHEPVNPLDNGVDKEASWNEHFVADVALLLECDAIGRQVKGRASRRLLPKSAAWRLSSNRNMLFFKL